MTPHDWFATLLMVAAEAVEDDDDLLCCDVDEGDRSSGGGGSNGDDGMVMVAFADGSISFERFVGFVKRRLLHSCGFFLVICSFFSFTFPCRSRCLYILTPFDLILFNNFSSLRYLFVPFARDDLYFYIVYTQCHRTYSTILALIYELSEQCMR